MAIRISYHQITTITLSLGLVCAIGACATREWYGGGLFDLSEETWGKMTIGFSIVGTAMLGFGLFIEILMIVSDKFRLNSAVNMLCLICCLVASATLVGALACFASKYQRGGYSIWLLTGSVVFAVEALLFYLLQWRCSGTGV